MALLWRSAVRARQRRRWSGSQPPRLQPVYPHHSPKHLAHVDAQEQIETQRGPAAQPQIEQPGQQPEQQPEAPAEQLPGQRPEQQFEVGRVWGRVDFDQRWAGFDHTFSRIGPMPDHILADFDQLGRVRTDFDQMRIDRTFGRFGQPWTACLSNFGPNSAKVGPMPHTTGASFGPVLPVLNQVWADFFGPMFTMFLPWSHQIRAGVDRAKGESEGLLHDVACVGSSSIGEWPRASLDTAHIWRRRRFGGSPPG